MRCIDQGTIKIFLIKDDFKGRYWIIQERSTITSTVSLEEAVRLLKSETFDLIVSEPHNLFILDSPYK
ncbi:MAG: hypothetical protein V2B13_13405 [Pseudomonadota bacterium]